jgi:hypothetical protein
MGGLAPVLLLARLGAQGATESSAMAAITCAFSGRRASPWQHPAVHLAEDPLNNMEYQQAGRSGAAGC